MSNKDEDVELHAYFLGVLLKSYAERLRAEPDFWRREAVTREMATAIIFGILAAVDDQPRVSALDGPDFTQQQRDVAEGVRYIVERLD